MASILSYVQSVNDHVHLNADESDSWATWWKWIWLVYLRLPWVGHPLVKGKLVCQKNTFCPSWAQWGKNHRGEAQWAAQNRMKWKEVALSLTGNEEDSVGGPLAQSCIVLRTKSSLHKIATQYQKLTSKSYITLMNRPAEEP